ncbi:MAG: LOG family protein [Calditrichaceae bacterium]|nr:LOG family protein [Calditrichaceae bacterium]MBN2708751.1 LOG family protein [Calditrichaceae bacterium]RQV97118.1 MAG: LOG family protein [Calditrichota bacterium]
MKIKPKAPKAYKNIDFLNSGAARPVRILAEFLEPYDRFKRLKIESTIVFFGSARIKSDAESNKILNEVLKKSKENPAKDYRDELDAARLQVRLSKYYEDAVELSRLLTKWAMERADENGHQSHYICSGGGPGIMQAANQGAELAGGKSIGLNISIPLEQHPNPYISEELMFEFHYFFMRKYWFAYLAKALIIFPGGFGTLDELMEILTLIQTKKITKFMPILVFGQDYWKDVIDFEALVRWGTVSRADIELLHFVNSPQEAFNLLAAKLGGVNP